MAEHLLSDKEEGANGIKRGGTVLLIDPGDSFVGDRVRAAALIEEFGPGPHLVSRIADHRNFGELAFLDACCGQSQPIHTSFLVASPEGEK